MKWQFRPPRQRELVEEIKGKTNYLKVSFLLSRVGVITIIADFIKMIEKQVFFLDIIGRSEAFSEHRFQVSGFRMALVFLLLTPDT
jgi:hypothetical protein